MHYFDSKLDKKVQNITYEKDSKLESISQGNNHSLTLLTKKEVQDITVVLYDLAVKSNSYTKRVRKVTIPGFKFDSWYSWNHYLW